MKVIRQQEKEFVLNEDIEILAQHGPCRVLMQGGKHVNIIQRPIQKRRLPGMSS